SPLYIPLAANPQLLRFLAGFARHCTPDKWREAMKIFAEVNRVALDVYDELAEGHANSSRDTRAHRLGDTDGAVNEATKSSSPHLAVFASDQDRQGLISEFDGVEHSGGNVDYEILTGDQVREYEPALSEAVTAGIAIHGQRFINPPKYMSALANAIHNRGAKIQTGFDVSAIRSHSGGVTITS